MRYIKLLTLLFALSTLIASCGKGDGMEELPKNNPSGDYFYQGHSDYFNSEGTIEHNGKASGSLSIKVSTSNSLLNINILPDIGYAYSIEGSNIQVHGDTTTFRIARQQIVINNTTPQTFTLEGTNGLKVGNLGYYDGYYTAKKIHINYRSINIESLDYVKTTLVATKRN